MRKRRKTRGMRPRPPSQHDRLGSNGNDSSASPTDRGGFLFVELPWVFLVVACVALPAHFAQFRDALESFTGWSKPHVSGFLGVVLFFIVVLAGLPILLAPVKSSFDWREFSSKCGLLYYSLVMAMWKAVGETGKYALVGGLVFTLVSAVYIASKQGRGFAAADRIWWTPPARRRR